MMAESMAATSDRWRPASLRHRVAVMLGAVASLVACTEDARGGAGTGGDGHMHNHSHDAAADALAADASALDAGALDAADALYDWPLPANFPVPKVPADNPVTPPKVELGRHLFYDKRLSGNGSQSCASCHLQQLAFTDGRFLALGSTGQLHPRNAMGLTNVAYASAITWANNALGSLEDQALVPMFGESPIELGLTGHVDELLATLASDPRYDGRFEASFPDDPEPVSLANVVKALATFQRALVSGGSAYDHYLAGEVDALSGAAKRGMDLFFSETLECFHCHGGFNLSGSTTHVGKVFDETTFHNNGLYNIGGTGAYPGNNQGLFALTGDPADMGRFKAPTLRNIAVTGPYMHDGTMLTLSQVLDHYAAGGRVIESGPFAGDGRASPLKSELITGFELSEQDKADVIAFLESLTDETFLTDPRYADPFAAP